MSHRVQRREVLRWTQPGKWRHLPFGFATQSKSEVTLRTAPKARVDAAPAYLPTRELLTIYPGFVSVYENHYLEFEETWRDTAFSWVRL